MTDKKTPAKAAKPKAKTGFTIIHNVGELNKAIGSIERGSKRLDALIHQAAVSVIVHSAKNNDPDVATRLVAALGKAMRRNAMKNWLVAYGAFKLDEHGALVYDKTRSEAVQKQDNINAAIAEPFWELTPDTPPYKQANFDEMLQRLLQRAEAALKNPEQDQSLIPPDKLAALRALAAGAPVAVVGDAPAAEV